MPGSSHRGTSGEGSGFDPHHQPHHRTRRPPPTRPGAESENFSAFSGLRWPGRVGRQGCFLPALRDRASTQNVVNWSSVCSSFANGSDRSPPTFGHGVWSRPMTCCHDRTGWMSPRSRSNAASGTRRTSAVCSTGPMGSRPPVSGRDPGPYGNRLPEGPEHLPEPVGDHPEFFGSGLWTTRSGPLSRRTLESCSPPARTPCCVPSSGTCPVTGTSST